MITLEWVKPTQIRDTWPTIKVGLEAVEDHSKSWVKEDVYMALRLGQCNLHLCMVDGLYRGFTVTQQQDHYGSPLLHIWCAYSEGKDLDILRECLDEIKTWAKTIEAKKVTFGSPRKGWAKKALKLGFTASPVITYELEIEL